MALGASLLAFVLACAAAGVTLFLGFSIVIAFLAYSVVGAISLLVAVAIVDALTKDGSEVAGLVHPEVAS